jgi:hypothetical protein
MQTHDAEWAYMVMHRCRRCGKRSLSAGDLERGERPDAPGQREPT